MTDLEIPSAVWSAWTPSSGARELRRALTDGERRALELRAAELRSALMGYDRPFEDDRVALAISDMFGGFRSMREHGEDVMGRVEAAMRVLAPFPAWAIEYACVTIQRDGYEVTDRDGIRIERHWPPSDPEICLMVEKVVKMRADALANTEALLAAPIEPLPAPRLTRAELEAKLGRAIGQREPFANALPPPRVPLSKEAVAAVAADTAARRKRKEETGAPV